MAGMIFGFRIRLTSGVAGFPLSNGGLSGERQMTLLFIRRDALQKLSVATARHNSRLYQFPGRED